MTKRVADVLIATLQAAGVERCYGIVGDTLNQIAHAIDRSAIQWVHMRHEEAGAFAAGAEAQLTGRLTACAGSCGPGSLHFINGLYEANRNRAPIILIASQIMRQDLGFESIQEVDFVDVYRGCTVFCRDDPYAGAGPPQDRRGLSGSADERGRRRPRCAGRCRQRHRARRTALRRPYTAPARSPERRGPRRDR
jgi:Thiamine pyrophosphate enzyme, N-terminal TPP binding domain